MFEALKEPTKITWVDGHSSFTIEIAGTGHSIDTIVSDLLEPLLLAKGFHPSIVQRIFGEDYE